MKRQRIPTGKISLRPRFRILCGKAIAFGPGKADLLEMIAETGSIGAAASRLGMSYMRAWSLIRAMNQCFQQPVVAAVRGGRQHGGAELTEAGQSILKLYRRMEQAGLRAAAGSWRQLQRHLRGQIYS